MASSTCLTGRARVGAVPGHPQPVPACRGPARSHLLQEEEWCPQPQGHPAGTALPQHRGKAGGDALLGEDILSWGCLSWEGESSRESLETLLVPKRAL